MTTETGICPKCLGTKRRPWPSPSHQYASITATYDAATDTLVCDNCGGQTMSLEATGVVPLRSDGTPCLHEWTGRQAGRCYYIYNCKHCPAHYDIDSSD